MDSVVISWLTEWASTVSLLDVIIGVVVVTTLVVLVKKKAWPWAVGVAEGLIHLSKMVAAVSGLSAFIVRTDKTLASQNLTLASQDRKIQEIHNETHDNHGSSLKDAVNRVEKTVNEVILPNLIGAGVDRQDDLDLIRSDIDGLRKAETVTTVEVIATKEAHARV